MRIPAAANSRYGESSPAKHEVPLTSSGITNAHAGAASSAGAPCAVHVAVAVRGRVEGDVCLMPSTLRPRAATHAGAEAPCGDAHSCELDEHQVRPPGPPLTPPSSGRSKRHARDRSALSESSTTGVCSDAPDVRASGRNQGGAPDDGRTRRWQCRTARKRSRGWRHGLAGRHAYRGRLASLVVPSPSIEGNESRRDR
jgi:hypothetical protein